MNEPDQSTLASLFVLVVFNNNFNSTENRGNLREVLREVGEDFVTTSVFSTAALTSHLDCLNDTFVKKSGSYYSTVHDKIYDILVKFFGNEYLYLLIEKGHYMIIRDRFQIQHSGHEVESFTELDIQI